MDNHREKVQKPILVKILQWFYLLLGVIAVASVFLYQNFDFIPTLGIGNEFIIGFFGLIAAYFLILSLSFFLQNTNLLILALVLIFFSTIGSLLLLVVSVPNAHFVINGNLPECSKNIATCNTHDGIIVASAALLSVAIPTLVLNIITIVGAIKGIAATD